MLVMQQCRLSIVGLFVLWAAIFACASDGVLPAGTVVLSRTHPNEKLIESGFRPVQAKLGESWRRLDTDSLPWEAVVTAKPVVFKGELWLVGGRDNGILRLEEDETWTQLAKSLPINVGRLAEHKGELWTLTRIPLGVWRSVDGKSWQPLTNAIPWTAKDTPTLLSHRDSLFAVGRKAVWVLESGGSWACTSDAPPWEDIEDASCLSFRGNILVLGGSQRTQGLMFRIDTESGWASEDGRQWKRLSEMSTFPPRRSHRCVAVGNRLFLFGGCQSVFGGVPRVPLYLNDVWSSEQGIAWANITFQAAWSPRAVKEVVVYKDQIYLFGGSQMSWWSYDDIWVTSPVRLDSEGYYYYEKK